VEPSFSQTACTDNNEYLSTALENQVKRSSTGLYFMKYCCRFTHICRDLLTRQFHASRLSITSRSVDQKIPCEKIKFKCQPFYKKAKIDWSNRNQNNHSIFFTTNRSTAIEKAQILLKRNSLKREMLFSRSNLDQNFYHT